MAPAIAEEPGNDQSRARRTRTSRRPTRRGPTHPSTWTYDGSAATEERERRIKPPSTTSTSSGGRRPSGRKIVTTTTSATARPHFFTRILSWTKSTDGCWTLDTAFRKSNSNIRKVQHQLQQQQLQQQQLQKLEEGANRGGRWCGVKRRGTVTSFKTSRCSTRPTTKRSSWRFSGQSLKTLSSLKHCPTTRSRGHRSRLLRRSGKLRRHLPRTSSRIVCGNLKSTTTRSTTSRRRSAWRRWRRTRNDGSDSSEGTTSSGPLTATCSGNSRRRSGTLRSGQRSRPSRSALKSSPNVRAGTSGTCCPTLKRKLASWRRRRSRRQEARQIICSPTQEANVVALATPRRWCTTRQATTTRQRTKRLSRRSTSRISNLRGCPNQTPLRPFQRSPSRPWTQKKNMFPWIFKPHDRLVSALSQLIWQWRRLR